MALEVGQQNLISQRQNLCLLKLMFSFLFQWQNTHLFTRSYDLIKLVIRKTSLIRTHLLFSIMYTLYDLIQPFNKTFFQDHSPSINSPKMQQIFLPLSKTLSKTVVHPPSKIFSSDSEPASESPAVQITGSAPNLMNLNLWRIYILRPESLHFK